MRTNFQPWRTISSTPGHKAQDHSLFLFASPSKQIRPPALTRAFLRINGSGVDNGYFFIDLVTT
jgi:hypothetical protein